MSETVTNTNFLAREMVLELNTGTTDVPIWTKVRFRSAFDPKFTPTREDTTTYDDNGGKRTAKTEEAWGATFTLDLYKMSGGGYLPEAEALRQAALAWGDDELVEVRWFNSAEAHQGFAKVDWERAQTGPGNVERVTVTLTGYGLADHDIPNPWPGGVEVVDWTVEVTGSPAGGTYTLTVTRNGTPQTTAAIAYNATASAVEDALEALSNVEPGDVTVTGTTVKTCAWEVGVTMTGDGSGLSGGTDPDVDVQPA